MQTELHVLKQVQLRTKPDRSTEVTKYITLSTVSALGTQIHRLLFK